MAIPQNSKNITLEPTQDGYIQQVFKLIEKERKLS